MWRYKAGWWVRFFFSDWPCFCYAIFCNARSGTTRLSLDNVNDIKYSQDQFCLGPFRPTIRSFSALVCSSVTILMSPTNLSEKNRTSIRLWIVTLIRAEFTCIVLLRDLLGTAGCNVPIVHPLTDRWISGYGHSWNYNWRGKYSALGESTVQCPIVHCTAQANWPVFKPSTPCWGCILQKSDNLSGSVRQHSVFQTVVRAPVLVRRFFMPFLKVCCHYTFKYNFVSFDWFLF